MPVGYVGVMVTQLLKGLPHTHLWTLVELAGAWA
jgi:hypothetical protein